MDAHEDRTLLARREADRQHADNILHLQDQIIVLQDRLTQEIIAIEARIQERLAHHEFEILDKAITRAVKQAFSHLGVDINDPKELQRFRDDLRFGGVFRNAASNGFFALIAAVCGGIGLSIWLLLKERMGIP